MRIRKLTDVRDDIFLLIGQFIVFVVSIWFINYIYANKIAPDKRVAEVFSVSQCKIEDKQLAMKGRVIKGYRAEFKVSYNTSNGPMSSLASANGMDFSFSSNKAAQQEYVDEFETGSIYPCWYDPIQPNIVVLVLRHNWLSTLPLLLPSLVAIIMFLYMIKTSVDIIEIYIHNKNKRNA